ncbi:alpha/beta fold hydrolase [Nocardia sp. 2]|uniref:Alpha/beta fold hydrolase n=1 Tax=Nocardia acididurans TaxID=2802282 RepID=A0ABS1MHL7_9NOCA|nr:alpha/beta fold hydrolase [Nocardia acididurans]MBL1080161.1 alpha/beta fold hydrolase [Nocardia acididurans]
MSEKTIPSNPDTGPRPRRPARGKHRLRRIALAVVTLLLVLAAGNAVLVSRETVGATGARIVRLAGGDIHLESSGVPGESAVVLLHGLAGSTDWWDPVLPALRDFYVIRVDLLGHGGSAKPATGYGTAEQARRVGAVLDHLGIRRATVIGHSTGGLIATSLAEQRRDLVTAITLIDTGPRADAFAGDSAVARLLTTPVAGQLLWRLRTDSTLRRGLSTAFARDIPIPDPILADIRGMTYRSLTATSDASTAFLRERPAPDRLAELGLPTLVIFGADDERWPVSSAEDYRRIPGVRIEILATGHTPMLEDPDSTGKLLRAFVTAPGR